MTEEILDLQQRVAEALLAGKMTREKAVKELMAGGFSLALAIDFVSITLDNRGE